MTTTIARHAFASLAMSAKLHRILDDVGSRHRRAHAETFEASMDRALHELERKHHGALRKEARNFELTRIKRDLDEAERLYRLLPDGELSLDARDRLNELFARLREKISEKELTL